MESYKTHPSAYGVKLGSQCPVAPCRVGAPRGSFAAGRDAARLSYPSQQGLHSSLQSPHPVSMRLLPTSVSDQLNPIPPTPVTGLTLSYGTPNAYSARCVWNALSAKSKGSPLVKNRFQNRSRTRFLGGKSFSKSICYSIFIGKSLLALASRSACV